MPSSGCHHGSMMPRIHPAVHADAGMLASLSLTVWEETYGKLIDPAALRRRRDEPATSREARWALRIATEKVIVAVDDRACVGFARSTPGSGREVAELLSLYTVRSHWRSGLGTRLLRESVQQTAAQLWVFDGNARALRFYEHHGFRLDGQRREDPPYGVELHMVRPGIFNRTV